MIPGGPRNQRQMDLMMRRMGMKTEAIDGVEEVVVRTRTKEHVFTAPEVTILTVQGVRTYRVVGTPHIRARTSGPPAAVAPAPTPTAPPRTPRRRHPAGHGAGAGLPGGSGRSAVPDQRGARGGDHAPDDPRPLAAFGMPWPTRGRPADPCRLLGPRSRWCESASKATCSPGSRSRC